MPGSTQTQRGLLRETVRGSRPDTPRTTVGSEFQNAEPETVFRNEIPFFMVMLTKSSKI